jgi:hypothetical protein
MHVDAEDLAALALDPAGVRPEVREHVAGCSSCRKEAEGLAAVAGGVRAAGAEGRLVPPPSDRRGRVLAAATEAAHPGPAVRDDGAGGDVVPLTPARTTRRGVPVWAAGLAAAVTLVAGLGLGRLTAGDGPVDQGGGGNVVAAADLTVVEGEDARGVAEAVRTDDVVTLRIDADALGDAEGHHEVWLLNVDGARMVAVGLLPTGDVGEFTVPARLLEQGYRVVDISVEPDDGDPTHSGVSLARGELV